MRVAEDPPSLFPMDMGVWYESRIAKVHYIGWHMHRHDFHRGAGGFTGGFRYLIRNLWQWARQTDGGSQRGPKAAHALNTTGVVRHIMERIAKSAADILVMQDGLILRDVLEVASGGQWTYLDGYNYNFLSSERKQDAATVYFAWGNSRSTNTILGEQFSTPGEEHEYGNQLRNVLLHPVIEWQGRSVHLAEEILNGWWSDRGAGLEPATTGP